MNELLGDSRQHQQIPFSYSAEPLRLEAAPPFPTARAVDAPAGRAIFVVKMVRLGSSFRRQPHRRWPGSPNILPSPSRPAQALRRPKHTAPSRLPVRVNSPRCANGVGSLSPRPSRFQRRLDAIDCMRREMIHHHGLSRTAVRHADLLQKGGQDLPIAAPFYGHGRHKAWKR